MTAPKHLSNISPTATATPASEVGSGKQRLRFRPLTALGLTKLALALRQQTVTEATEAIRALGVAPRRVTAQTVLDRRADIDDLRNDRRDGREVEAQRSMAQRLHTYKASKVFPVTTALFRHGAASGGGFTLRFVEKSSEVRYKVEIGSNRDTYAGSFKGWSATEDHHRIRVPRD